MIRYDVVSHEIIWHDTIRYSKCTLNHTQPSIKWILQFAGVKWRGLDLPQPFLCVFMAHCTMDFALHLIIIIIIRHKLGFNRWVDNIIMDLQQVGYGGDVRTWNM